MALLSFQIEKVHIKFCKFLLGVNKRAVNLAVKGKLGCFPTGISCMLQAFKYWYHIQSSNNLILLEALAVSETFIKSNYLLGFHFLQVYAKR